MNIKKLFTGRFFLIIFFFAFFTFLARYAYLRLGAFSFGDEWTNFIAGYFMTKGKHLYSEIFYNHQMLAAYISYILQSFFQPNSLYQLVLYHRMFLFFFSLICNIIIIRRFGFAGGIFVVVYELSKFYLFGYVFLAESFVVQPLVYIFGLAWESMQGMKISKKDILLTGVFTWLVIFMREIFIPVSLCLYGFILYRAQKKDAVVYSVVLFLFLSLLVVFSLVGSLKEYLHQVVIFNIKYMIPAEAKDTLVGIGLAKAFFYPFTIFFTGTWTQFRFILIALSIVFFLSLIRYFLEKRKIFSALFIFFVLGLCSLRYIPPGVQYFQAFHLLPWYGVFIMITVLLFLWLQTNTKQTRNFFFARVVLILLFIVLLSPQSFLWEKVDKEREFSINYVHYHIPGEVIKALAKPGDTLFADEWDYLIHFPSGLLSSYPYGIYSFATRSDPVYAAARVEMFQKNPPDFYYTYCTENQHQSEILPSDAKPLYQQLYHNNKPSCIYVKKTKLHTIKQKQWDMIKQYGYSLENK